MSVMKVYPNISALDEIQILCLLYYCAQEIMHLKTLMNEVHVINITNTIMLMLFQDMITVESDSHNLFS